MVSPCHPASSLSGVLSPPCVLLCFFFNDTATTEIYTLSLHDALPISRSSPAGESVVAARPCPPACAARRAATRSEEHTSELQSRLHLVCRLLLEKKKNKHGTGLQRGVGRTHLAEGKSRHRDAFGPLHS